MQLNAGKSMAKVPVSSSRLRCTCQVFEQRCFWDGGDFFAKSEKARMPMQEFDVFVLWEYYTVSFNKITAFKSPQKGYNMGVRTCILQDSSGKSGLLSRE